MSSLSIHFESGRLSRLIGLGYEAALSRTAWREFANDFAAASGSQMAMIQYIEDAQPERSFLVCGGLGSDFEEAFGATHWRSDDDQFWAAIRSSPSGTVKLSQEILPLEIMRKSPDYARVALPWKLEHFLISSIDTGNGSSAFLSLGRTAGEAPFVHGDKALVSQAVLAHLRRSFALRTSVDSTLKTCAMLSAVVDRTPYGVVVFDTHGRPVVVNRRASKIFAATEGLTLINDRLHAADPAAHARLESALAIALHGALGATIAPPDPVLVPRKGDKHPYQVAFSLLNLRDDRHDLPSGSAVLAMIQQGWLAGPRYVPVVLRSTYNLTRAEIRLCQALLDGKSLVEAGNSLSISRNTAKTHLARIFDKTSVRSQAALLRLLSLGIRP